MKVRSVLALALGILALALAGCSPAHLYSADAGFARTSTVTVHVDASVTAHATKAIAWWNALAGRPLFVVTTAATAQVTIRAAAGGCGPVTADRVACSKALPSSGVFASPPAYAYISCEVIASELGATYWEVYAHELGHCLGFDHVTDRPSIMNVHPDSTNRAADQAMLSAAGYR